MALHDTKEPCFILQSYMFYFPFKNPCRSYNLQSEGRIYHFISSISPIIKKASSGVPSILPERIISHPSIVLLRGTCFPFLPVNSSVRKKGCVRKLSRRLALLTIHLSAGESSSIPSIAIMSRSSLYLERCSLTSW